VGRVFPDGRVEVVFERVCPDGSQGFVWIDALVRHEALENRVVMKGHHRWSVAADRLKLRAA
jgi:hypothetical protein